MDYYNCDGYPGTMCGNGGRCIVAFAHLLGFKKFTFDAYDGIHNAKIIKAEGGRKSGKKIVSLQIRDVKGCKKYKNKAYLLDTGSQHYVEFIKEGIENFPMFERGKEIRYHKDFQPNGMNLNFVEPQPSGILKIRTYEKGVENETLACGTGSTASAIAAYCNGIKPSSTKKSKNGTAVKYNLKALGGNLSVEFIPKRDEFTDVWLTGEATKVFECDIEI